MARIKQFYLLYSMSVGGVEKSLLGLLDTLDPEEKEVHVGLFYKKGGFLDQIPDWVHVHEISAYQGHRREMDLPPLMVIKKLFCRGRVIEGIMHLFLYAVYKLTGSRYLFYKYILRNEPMFPIEFDEAYAYAGPTELIDYYICKKVKAKKRFGWIHFDVQKFGIAKGMTRKLYPLFEKVYVVSETAKEKFDELFPEFASKTEVRYNIVSERQIRALSEEGETFSDDYLGKRILTVGRLSQEKGQTECIRALKLLVNKGCDVRWYFVGDGNLLQPCVSLSEELGIRECCVFLGTKTNPYGYMRDCDIYVQPSRHEGYCLTLAEARCFTASIVATNFTGAEEQLRSYPKSMVTGMDADEIADGIMKYL